MLVLKRNQGQGVDFTMKGADAVRVHVLEVHGNQVKLGIEAPRSVAVVRTELVGEPPRQEPTP